MVPLFIETYECCLYKSQFWSRFTCKHKPATFTTLASKEDGYSEILCIVQVARSSLISLCSFGVETSFQQVEHLGLLISWLCLVILGTTQSHRAGQVALPFLCTNKASSQLCYNIQAALTATATTKQKTRTICL